MTHLDRLPKPAEMLRVEAGGVLLDSALVDRIWRRRVRDWSTVGMQGARKGAHEDARTEQIKESARMKWDVP